MALLASAPLPLAQASPERVQQHLDGTLAYLERLLQDGQAEDEMSPYLVEAAVAAGLDPERWPPNASVVALSREYADETSRQVLIYRLRAIHGLAAAGLLAPSDPLVQGVLNDFNEGQFGSSAQANDDIWTLLTLPLAGVPVSDPRLQSSADFLLATQDASGGWGWAIGMSPDADDTGMAVQALASVGRLNATSARRAIDFIADQTYQDGGTALVRPGPPNCDSTIWSIRAHAVAGLPIPQRAWQFLHSLRLPDGAFSFTQGSDAAHICTAEAATILGDALRCGWDVAGYGGRDAPGVPPRPAGRGDGAVCGPVTDPESPTQDAAASAALAAALLLLGLAARRRAR